MSLLVVVIAMGTENGVTRFSRTENYFWKIRRGNNVAYESKIISYTNNWVNTECSIKEIPFPD